MRCQEGAPTLPLAIPHPSLFFCSYIRCAKCRRKTASSSGDGKPQRKRKRTNDDGTLEDSDLESPSGTEGEDDEVCLDEGQRG